ncbi:hypothetical protein BGW39_000734, partial [Mortierella sp. 14UC]
MFPIQQQNTVQYARMQSSRRPTLNLFNIVRESPRDEFANFGQERAKTKKQIDLLVAKLRATRIREAGSASLPVSSSTDKIKDEQGIPDWGGGSLTGSPLSGLTQRFGDLEITMPTPLTSPNPPRFTPTPASEPQLKPVSESEF